MPLSEIAFLLGYSEFSAFSRAFRRWHDVSPRDFREKIWQNRVRRSALTVESPDRFSAPWLHCLAEGCVRDPSRSLVSVNPFSKDGSR